ncbi:MAG: ABC-F family ATP-binding cassette domain-containing protein [Desulfobacula sp.]|jgi:ABC transport system ATP-binding/permease protein|uniref:ABC-F family ATP-binding cassette domain-containing protein n=1 Tax=Desulfobacula sp. TaxID=2593537 RepID=UPI001D897543|nr:ABC-F family ATP-binding cassette domain-containing protein [Desulfobacula sp.]MBT3486439.1 ABC-F family ATP-binding cassette domain-containing protein [Desulfobacula sp.]MBT3805060.1 ABC-F family ATP-binding cassette domain-containing protein [Desulfobacula sp.]MBT4025562.1 ABC-F family ATP-binding cassette domain-containing protein [Desulfobacula sp.]MBT4199710.1 ABC-F family ATP-binding cassette domain-containing protein [Desulfobacula sp.]
MSFIFSLKNISKTYGDDTLFHDLSIDFKLNEQMGLIGMNGSGKSTFLKLIANITQPDTGDLITKSGLRVIYLSQEDRLEPDQTVEQILYNSIKDSPFDDKQRHKIVQTLLGKGGFTDTDIISNKLSGGWTKKLAITRALCRQPDVLLLDEPTNHLDINGILWLEEILKTAGFSFIVVSHDRAFIENICSNVMEIGKYYPSGYFKIQGQYKKFEKERHKFLKAQQTKQASLSSKMRREDEWLKQGPKARSTKAKYRIEQAQNLKMELYALKDRNKNTATMDIDFQGTGRQTKKLLRAYNLKKSMAGKSLFSDISFEIGPGFCLGIVGENGSGKSTLLSILEKKTLPDKGKVQWAENLKVSIFDQKRSRLNPVLTLKEALNPGGGDSVNYNDRSIHIVTWAKRFLFMPDQLEMPVKSLSGGEKARIILANIMLTPCDLLLLDEPTNDLDILSLEVLEDSIQQFAGAVIIVSHDRYLMDKVCHKILYLDPKAEARFFKDFNQIMNFRKTLGEKSKKIKKLTNSKKQPSKTFSYKDKYELEHIEEKIVDAEAEVQLLSDKIQEPEIIRNPEKMKKYCSLLKLSQEKAQDLYKRWEDLEDKKDRSAEE